MATRRPFWKWHRWKSIGFCLWPPSTCIWNLKLKFQSKLELCSGNHVVYRQTDGQTDRRTDKVNPVYPPSNFVGRVYNDVFLVEEWNGAYCLTRVFNNRDLYKSCRSTVFTSCLMYVQSILCAINCAVIHSGRMMHICVGDLLTIGSDYGLSPCRRQAIFWSKAVTLIGPLGINFSANHLKGDLMLKQNTTNRSHG